MKSDEIRVAVLIIFRRKQGRGEGRGECADLISGSMKMGIRRVRRVTVVICEGEERVVLISFLWLTVGAGIAR